MQFLKLPATVFRSCKKYGNNERLLSEGYRYRAALQKMGVKSAPLMKKEISVGSGSVLRGLAASAIWGE